MTDEAQVQEMDDKVFGDAGEYQNIVAQTFVSKKRLSEIKGEEVSLIVEYRLARFSRDDENRTKISAALEKVRSLIGYLNKDIEKMESMQSATSGKPNGKTKSLQ
jgi:anaerobic ribonucleoside-triphosphate reductase